MSPEAGLLKHLHGAHAWVSSLARLPLLLPALLLLCLPTLVPAPPASVQDAFISNCTQIPSTQWSLWSNPSTWAPLGFTGVPGLASLLNVNVTIPCGMAVLLDVPGQINLTVLEIQGHLKVSDPAVPVVYSVFACAVLVEGQLTIGSFASQFKSKITFTLMPNPMNRQNWAGTFVWPAEPAYPRSIGHKVFAVMGGQVSLHGMPGGGSTPSWVKLGANVIAGDWQIVLDTDVSSSWPVGASIAVSSSDYMSSMAEEFIISAYDTDPRGCIIVLNRKATYSHWGDFYGNPDGLGGFLDQRAEVALLTRNIMITGLDEQNTPYLYQGGHFIIFMTPVPQYIEGVEYYLMGQQGTLGRYNIHFHFCMDTRGLSVVRKNAIHNSKQRCVVVHATHNLTVDSNVAYNTSGHCFMVEEGSEQNNTFINNLGFMQRAVVNLIADDETDGSPATFWITNMFNNYINNVAGGSENSGFWTELRPNVRGMSLMHPSLNGIIPSSTSLLYYYNNTAHSNNNNGWQFYPKGVRPATIWDVNKTTLSQWQWPGQPGYIYNLNLWKQRGDAVFMHNSANVYLVNVTAADSNIGVNLRSNYAGGVINGRFVALSNIPGNPNSWQCYPNWDTNNCAPMSGCSMSSDPKSWRFRGWNSWLSPTFGIHLDSPNSGVDGNSFYNLTNNRFSGYENNGCGRISAAYGTGMQGNTLWWNAGTFITGFKASSPALPPFYFAPGNISTWNGAVTPYSEIQTNYAVWDRDGSIMGGTGGYLLANYAPLFPPLGRFSCTPKPDMFAVYCPNTCYRTVWFQYQEPNFTPLPSSTAPTRTRGQFSYLIVRRVEDNVTHILDGNANTTDANVGTTRNFYVSLFAPATYEVTLGLPTSNLSFWPSSLTIQYTDGGACGAVITLRMMAVPSNQWTVSTADNTFWSPCPGTTWSGKSVSWPVQFQYVCHKYRQVLQLSLQRNMDASTKIQLLPSGLHVDPCRLPLKCGVYTSSDWYYYNTGGMELRPPKPGAMGYTVPGNFSQPWAYGQAMLGNSGWGWSAINTLMPMSNSTYGTTFYYRKTFTVSNSACYSGLYLDFIPLLGHLLFLNNQEVFRWNLPLGNISNTTFALSGPAWPNPWMTTTFINLTANNASFVEGTNYLAFETHVPWSGYGPYFDTRLALLSTSPACKGASIMPEVCDGLDNNFDGLVDMDPVTRQVLTRPCSTACGSGTETCINGAYQNCTAPPSLPELCNGKDDNCDGLVDNGVVGGQMDCAPGSVCFKGSCLVQGNLTYPQTIFNRSTGPWYYLDNGWPWQTYPKWTQGIFSNNPNNTVIYAFTPGGVTPFATSNYTGPFTTKINSPTSTDLYDYYLRNFTLSAADAANTYSLSVSVRRDNGAVVWSNGVEVMRSNFPDASTWNPATTTGVFPLSSTDKNIFWPNYPLRSTGVQGNTVKAGTNWVAAQVASNQWQSNTFFDLELVRNVNVSCSSLPGSPSTCVRNPPNDTSFFSWKSVWKYLDATYPLPPFTWHLPSFDDSAWPSGPGPLGLKQWIVNTPMTMNRTLRQTYYFRKTFSVSDASCYFNVTFNIQALDGAVVYVNGVEAFRFQYYSQWVLPTSFAGSFWPSTDRGTFSLPTGWIVQGNNTVAVETHVSSFNTGNWYFDLDLSGKREAINCSPLPP